MNFVRWGLDFGKKSLAYFKEMNYVCGVFD